MEYVANMFHGFQGRYFMEYLGNIAGFWNGTPMLKNLFKKIDVHIMFVQLGWFFGLCTWEILGEIKQWSEHVRSLWFYSHRIHVWYIYLHLP